MLKKTSDRIKSARKALIAREYQDLPIEIPVSVAKELPRNPASPPDKVYGRLFYSGMFTIAIVVVLIVL